MRCRYIRDIIFAGFLDDYLQSTLSSFLLFINVDVCQKLAEDDKFLGTLFDLLENPSGVSVDGWVPWLSPFDFAFLGRRGGTTT